MTPSSWPDVVVYLAVGTPAKADEQIVGTLSDLTPYIWLEQGPIQMRWGRATELDRIEAGQISLTLRDPDRRFDPTNINSPYYPYIRPGSRLVVRARWPKGSGPYRTLFTGYIDTWQPQFGNGTLTRAVQIRGSDAFAILALEKVSLVSAGDMISSVAVSEILNAIGWPATKRLISTGTAVLQEREYTAAAVLGALQDIARAENGNLFINRTGQVVFRDRNWRNRNRTIEAVFGNEVDRASRWILGQSLLGTTTIPRASGWTAGSTNELPMLSLKGKIDDRLIRNDVRMTVVDGVEQQVTDLDSQTAYGVRTYSESGLLMLSDAEALLRAQYFAYKYAQPRYRVEDISVSGHMAPDLMWPLLLNTLDVDRRVWVLDRIGNGHSNLVINDCRIEAVEHTISRERWTTSYKLSPDEGTLFWLLEDSTYGVLDETSIAGY